MVMEIMEVMEAMEVMEVITIGHHDVNVEME
jgi:hypothetical protein